MTDDLSRLLLNLDPQSLRHKEEAARKTMFQKILKDAIGEEKFQEVKARAELH